MGRFFLPGCLLQTILFAGLGFVAESSAGSKSNDAVAEVDSHRITVGAFRQKLLQLRENQPGKGIDALREAAVNELINEQLVRQKARLIRVEGDTVFMRRADQLLSQVAVQELFNQVVTSIVSVSDSEIVERHRQRPEDYQVGEWVRASHILIAPVKDTLLMTARQKETGWWADSDSKAKAIADSLHRLMLSGASFDSLARHWSQDMASGIKGGDLGPFPRGYMVPEFDSVAFTLEVGALSPPVKSRFGYHLIKVTARQSLQTAPLSDSLKQVIFQQMTQEKILRRTTEYLDSVQQAFGLVFNEKALEMPDSALQAQRIWAVASSSGDTVWSDRLGIRLVSVRPIARRPVDREFKVDLLKELITPFLLRRTAREIGILDSEAYQVKKEQLYQNEQIAQVLKEASLEYNPAPDEIEAYFQEHKTEFFRTESLSVHVQQMVFKTRKEAERVLGELRSGADFALLARKYFPGDSDIAQEAFDLGFIYSSAMPGDFFAVAETLTIGAASQPIRTRWGYHLIRVLARRPDLSLEIARPKIIAAIRKAKQEEHRKTWEEALRAGHTIKIHKRVLRGVYIPPADFPSAGR